MALTIETRTLGDQEWNFIVTKDDAGTLYGFVQDALSTLDTTTLEDVDTNGTGDNLEEKLTGYKLKTNGQDGFETYQNSIVNIDRFISNVRANRSFNKAAAGDAQAQLEDHEERITELETT